MRVSSTSGAIKLQNITAGQLDVESISGSQKGENILSAALNASSTSGAVTLQGDMEQVACETISGKVALTPGYARSLHLESTSGSVHLALPKDHPGFTLERDTVSGKLNCDFPITQHRGASTFGDGSAEIKIETVSGSLHLYAQ